MPTRRQDKYGQWFVDFTWEGKRQRKFYGKGPLGKKAAEAALAEITLKIHHKKMGLVEEIEAELFFDKYLDYAKANKARSSYKRDITIISHLLPLIAGKKLSQVKAVDVEGYKLARLRTVSKATINRELNTILAAFNKAVEWGYLGEAALKSVKKFKESKKHPRFFSKEEIALIFANVSNQRHAAIIGVLLYTGLRRAELMHLEWRDVDLDKGTLSVQPKPNWHPKDYEARTIPLSPKAQNLIKAIPQTGPMVFDDGTGKFCMGERSLTRVLERVLKRTGIKNACLHTLRHTYASHLVMSGVDLPTVQKLLGHSDIRTTMRYAHLAPHHLKNAVTKLDQSYCLLGIQEDVKIDKESGKIIDFSEIKK